MNAVHCFSETLLLGQTEKGSCEEWVCQPPHPRHDSYLPTYRDPFAMSLIGLIGITLGTPTYIPVSIDRLYCPDG